VSILTLDDGGPNEMDVDVQKAGHAEPRTVGARVYALAGNERSWIRRELMVVPVILSNAPPADVALIRAMFARGGQVMCSGDVFNNSGTPVQCSGEITDEMEVGTTDKYWITNLTLSEVGS
jgi:hypothetical protein